MSKNRSAGKIAVDRDLISSKAYLDLTGIAPQVFLLFLARRKFERIKMGNKRKREWTCTNQDRLSFTYEEAEALGIERKRFTRAIDQLIQKGLLDVKFPGGVIRGNKSIYGLSDRWKLYGTDQFEVATRQKDNRWIGYRRPSKRGAVNAKL